MPDAARLAPFVSDTFESTPEYEPLRRAVVADDWELAEAHLATLAAPVVTYTLADLARERDADEFLVRAAERHPRSPYANVAFAHRSVMRSWEVRSDRPADQVSSEQFARFRDGLLVAERLLIDVCAHDPAFAPAWSLRVVTARGLEVGKAEARRRYARTAALSPGDLPTQAQMLQYLSPKWFGSVEEAGDFARECASAGGPSSALIGLHHIEEWLRADDRAQRAAYLADPATRSEIDAASSRLLASGAGVDPVTVLAHSILSMVLWLAGARQSAFSHADAAGGRQARFPWNYLPNSAARFQAAYAAHRDERKEST